MAGEHDRTEPRSGTSLKHEGATWQNASDVKLRNAHLAAIDRSKVLDYLLNEAHPDNGGKAVFRIARLLAEEP